MVEATIHGIDRGTILLDENYHVEATTVATAADPNPTVSRVETTVYNLVIEHPEGTLLWDTGSHPEAGDGHWPGYLYDAFEHVDAAEHPLDEDLERAGFGIDDVDCVLQTHLHMDHAGGLDHFAGTDTPVFVHADELEFAYFSAVTGEGSAGYVKADFDHDLDWRVVHGERIRPFEDVELFQLRGHTPGLLAMVVHLGGHATVLFTSDAVDVAANYERERPPGPGICRNRDEWYESLRTLKAIARRHDAEVVYGHDADQLDRVTDGWP